MSEMIPDGVKVNNTPKQKKIKIALEEIGHTNVKVWWENLTPAIEMCGPGGGYCFISDQNSMGLLGYSFTEAMDSIKDYKWLDVRMKGAKAK
jgi:hypothetical protein